MHTHKKKITSSGVVFITTLFFYSGLMSEAVAQINDSRLLLEVQSMRQEIAELRDLVERQQYELNKLKRGQQNGVGAGGVQNRFPNSSSQTPVPQSLPAQNSPPQTVYQQGEFQGNTYQGNTGVGQGNAANVNTRAQGDLSGAYNPDADPNSPTYGNNVFNGSTTDTANGGGVARPTPGLVESVPGRVIGSAPTPNTVSQDTNYQSPNYQNPSYQGAVNQGNGQLSGVPVEERLINPGVDANGNPIGRDNLDPAVPNNSGPRDTGFVDNGFQADAQTTNVEPTPNGAIPNGAIDGGIVPVPSAPQAESNPPELNVANNGSAAVPARFSEEDLYQQGFELLKKAEHDAAVKTFQQQISNYPQGDLVDDAYYWIAESLYVNRNLDESKRNFRTIIDRYTQSPRVPDAMLKTAYIEQEQGNAIEARILLQEILQFHPRSNAAISAKNRLGDLE